MSPAPTATTTTTTPANGNSNGTTNGNGTATKNPIPAWVAPDLTRLLHVEHHPGAFTSLSRSLVTLPPNAVFARITSATPATKAYSTVQASPTLHVELNSDLVYINHSCAPKLIFDMEAWEVRVNPLREQGLRAGDELTFFYPSTEWDMEQGFACRCGEKECLGEIKGAGEMERGVLEKYWVGAHVRGLVKERDGVEMKGVGEVNA